MIRSAFALVVLLGLGVAQAQGAKEAKALFEAMEAKLNAAKTLKVSFDSVMGPEGQQLSFKGEMCLGEGNLGKLDIKGKDPAGNPLTLAMTCNGTHVQTTEEEEGRGRTRNNEAPANFGEVMRSSFVKLSTVAGVFMTRVDADDQEPFALDGFVLGAKERDETRSLQVVEYDVTSEHSSFHVKLWIDTTSGLPFKRVLDRDQQKAAITETYTSIEVDPTLPADTFKVTREAKAEDEAPTSRPHPGK